MDYNMLLDSHKRFGTTKEDIATSNHQRDILENVVIAPWWKVKMFENKNDIMVTFMMGVRSEMYGFHIKY